MKKLLFLALFNNAFAMPDLNKQKSSVYQSTLVNNASIEMLTLLQYLNTGLIGIGFGYFS